MTKVGCCGWAVAQSKYFSVFPVVEIQSTFYDPPSNAVVTRWRDNAPLNAEFCIKAWQLITHTPASPTYRRLRTPVDPAHRDLLGAFRPTQPVHAAWQRTAEIAEILRATVVVFQCPASFLPTDANIQNLSAFFRHIGPQPFRLAWEPRGPAWPSDIIHQLCAEHSLLHCVDPFVNDSVYGEPLYWRLHGKGGYSYRYTDGDLAELHRRLGQREAYVMFNNMAMKQDAQRFQGL